MKNTYLYAASVLALTCAQGALAQGQADAEGAADVDVLDTIIVTGSRIARDGFTTPTPVTVVDAAVIETSGFVNIDDILQRVPAVGVGLGSANTLRQDDAGAAFVNLRGLGTNRSLTVVNGRRRVSGSRASSAVDLNTIPASMIERVEVISGGASAIYGADAVSGVVNVITKTDFDGLELAARGGVSQRGGGANYSLSAHGGTRFAEDRGSINVGVTYAQTFELLATERDFGQTWVLTLGNPDNTGPADGIVDIITIPDFQSTYLTDDVNFFVDDTAFIYTADGLDTVTGDLIRGGELGFQDGGNAVNQVDFFQLRIPQDTVSIRGDLTYRLTDGVSVFAEAEFSTTDSSTNTQYYRFDQRGFWLNGNGGPRIQRDNLFLPAEVAALMDAEGLTELAVRKRFRDELGALRNIHDRTTYTVVSGLKGAFANGWQWQAFYQYGAYDDSIRNTNLFIASNFLAAVDVIADPATGQPVCRDAAARAHGCVPYNLFQRGPLTQDQRDYMVHTRLQRVENTQRMFGAELTGEVVMLPAGAVSFAAGVERRKETLQTQDDGLSLNGEVSFLGLASPRQPVDEDFSVTEGFVEVLVPVLRDIALVEALEVEGAVRLSDYDTIGTATAWKAGLNWSVSEDVRLRFTRSRNVRAPNLIELFGPSNLTNRNFIDPCDITRIAETPNREANCRAFGIPEGFVDSFALTEVFEGGNPELTEETSNSLTVGAVITPRWIAGLSLSIDYWAIRIDDAISRFGAEEVADRCFDAASIDNVFCDLITLGDDFNLDRIQIIDINVSELRTSGIDLAASYAFDAAALGRFGIDLIGTYLIEKEQLVVPDDPNTLVVEDGEYTDPTLRLNVTLSYLRGGWTVNLINRYISGSDIDRQASAERYDISEVGARVYTDLLVGYDIDERVSVFAGINNLLDKDPPYSAFTYTGGQNFVSGGSATLYDNIGRFFHFGARARF